MAAAAALLASTAGGAIALFDMKHDVVAAVAVAQGGLYAVFAFLLWRDRHRLTEREARRAFIFLLLMAATMRALLVFATPHSTDIYRYVWDGRVQAEGINPYRYVPADPALAPLRDDIIYAGINRKDYAHTIYAPAAEIVFFLVSRVSETVSMMKLAMLAFEALAIFALVKLLAARRLPLILAALYALHPLPVWEIAGSGHVDILAVCLSMLALLAAEKGWRFASGAALAAGTLTKYFPFALTPAIYSRWDWKMPLAFAATVLALYAPYIAVGKNVLGFLGGYAGEEFSGGEGLYIAALLKELGFGDVALPVFVALAAIALFFLSWRTGFRPAPEKPDLRGAFAIAVAFTVFVSPHYPWYFLWLVPFLCFFPSPAVFWLTLSAPAMYLLPWPPTVLGASVLYLPFAVLSALEHWKILKFEEAPDGHAIA